MSFKNIRVLDMAKIKPKFYKTRIQPTNALMYVAFTDEQLQAALSAGADRYKLNGWREAAEAVTPDLHGWFLWSDEQAFIYVLMLPEEYNEATVWHEALHVTTRMWEQAGAELHPCHNDEVLTYTMNHVVEQIQSIYALHEDILYGL